MGDIQGLVIPKHVLLDPNLKPMDKILLPVLGTIGEDEEFPNTENLARILNFTPFNVRLSLRRLTRNNYLVENRNNGKTEWRPTEEWKQKLKVEVKKGGRSKLVRFGHKDNNYKSKTDREIGNNLGNRPLKSNSQATRLTNVSLLTFELYLLGFSSCEAARTNLEKAELSRTAGETRKKLKESLKKTQNQPFQIPLYVKRHLIIWRNSGLPKHQERATRTMRRILRDLKELRKGTFFNKFPSLKAYHDRPFTLEEFEQAVRHYAKAVKYRQAPECSLPDFLYNRFRTQGTGSLFLDYLNYNPSSPEVLEDKHPVVTNLLVENYMRTKDRKKPLNQKEQNAFILASRRIEGFFKKHGNKMDSYHTKTPAKRADLVVKAVLGRGFPEIYPGTFLSSQLFTTWLPDYLSSQGIMRR